MHPVVQRFVDRVGRAPRLLIFVGEDWAFYSHRLPLAKTALAAGFQVTVVCRVQAHADAIAATGATVRGVPIRRGRSGPLDELAAIGAVVEVYRETRPDVAHQVTMKPVLYGTLAARLSGAGHTVNAVAGLGYIFLARGVVSSVLRALVRWALRAAVRHGGDLVILQNPDDVQQLVQHGIARPDQVRLIRGAGVDLKEFAHRPLPEGVPMVVLPARLLRDKGVTEFVEAAARLKARGVAARFVLVGSPDPENPTTLTEPEIRAWVDSGPVEWWGNRDDMPEILAGASVVCLPSYREGLPKALLEGAATGRALVTTDVPGCREVVRDGVNGLLVPARDPLALSEALERLLLSSTLRAEMGARSRAIAEAEFGSEAIAKATLDVYLEGLETA